MLTLTTKTRITLLALFASLALTLTPAAATDTRAAPPGRQFEFEVRELVFRGLEGDVEALEKALALCNAALGENPDDPEALVWHGSTSLVLSGVAYSAGDLGSGGILWQRGLDEMARAVELAPEDIAVLIPRAAALLGAARNVPFPQQARELTRTAVGDYERVYALQRPYFDRMSEHARGELLLGIVDGHQRLGQEAEVRRYLEVVKAELPGSSYAETAKTYLNAEPGSGVLSVRTCHGCHTLVEEIVGARGGAPK